MAKVVPHSGLQRTQGSVAQDDLELPRADNDFRRGCTYRGQEKETYLLFISDPLRIKWDILITVLAIYTCFSVPFRLAFAGTFSVNDFLSILDLVIDVFFIFDIYVNFTTSYIDVMTGEEITNKRKIAAQYAKSGRLFVDMAASVPVDLLSFIVGVTPIITLVKLVKLLRLLRLGKTIHHLRAAETVKVPVKIGIMVILILIYLHVLACCWYALVCVENQWVSAAQSVQPTVTFSSTVELYIAAVYSALGTLVQFELSPTTEYEYLFCLGSLLAGALISSYMLSGVALLVASLNRRRVCFFSTLDQINTTAKNLKLPSELQVRVVQHFTQTHRTLLHHREWERFQKLLPRSWVRAINMCMYTSAVTFQPVFRKFSEIIDMIVFNLEYAFLTPDMFLFQAGDHADRFCFIVEGLFEVWTEDLDSRIHLANRLKAGDYCGEIGILYQVPRTASVKAVEYSNVGCIPEKTFRHIIMTASGLDTELRIQACKYRDPRRRTILVRPTQRMLRKVSYLHRLAPLVLDQIYYSLQLQSFVEGAMVYERGAAASQVYFVLSGSVSICMNLYDSDLQRRVHFKHCTIGTELMLRTPHTLRKSRAHKRRNASKLVALELAELESGSIFCGMLALFNSELVTHCVVKRTAHLLVLPTSTLEAFAENSVQLRLALLRTKKMFQQDNSLFGEVDLMLPVIDCYKHFYFESREEIQSWRALNKFRNAVVTVILRSRERIRSKIFSKYALLRKLSAIKVAETRGCTVVAKKIEAGQLPPSVVTVQDLLETEELSQPIRHQFALLQKKWENAVVGGSERLAQVESLTKTLVSLRVSVAQSAVDVRELVDFIERLTR